jgi:hypothetical protein
VCDAARQRTRKYLQRRHFEGEGLEEPDALHADDLAWVRRHRQAIGLALRAATGTEAGGTRGVTRSFSKR